MTTRIIHQAAGDLQNTVYLLLWYLSIGTSVQNFQTCRRPQHKMLDEFEPKSGANQFIFKSSLR